MFAQTERLDRITFTDVYKHGRRVHRPGLLLIYTVAPTQKMAVVVGKKVARGAVARNRLKRRLSAALYETKMRRGHVIVIAKPAASMYTYARLHTEIVSALTQAFGLDTRSR